MNKRIRNTSRRRLTTERLEDRRLLAAGPYAPAAGQLASTAVSYQDPAIVAWATAWQDYKPGIEVDPQFMTPEKAVGAAINTPLDVVSLGRGGEITLRFSTPIRNGLGNDFAVFENGVADSFLELAFVEVSSNGVDFFRFANDSLTKDPVSAFGELDPTKINGLAGKYRVGFGTPFDLAALEGISPKLDLNAVNYVRIIDITGDGLIKDSSGDPIYDPFPTVQSAGFDLDAIGVINQSPVSMSSVGFEDVGKTLATPAHWNGPDPNGTTSIGAYNENTTVGIFSSDRAKFSNAYSLDSGSWTGWAYSSETDATTAGFMNQFSAIAGSGDNDSKTYGVGFFDQSNFYPPPTIELPADAGSLSSVQITNTTYAALSMKNGDSFSKKFGGASGSDPDWLLLKIHGADASGASIGVIDFYLADYRSENVANDYIIETWTSVDLSSLSGARSLSFTLSSSDVGTFGMNTPAYFALDNLTWTTPGIAIDFLENRIVENAGNSEKNARITRGGNIGSPMTINLTSDNPKLKAPQSVTIPAGQSSFDFSIAVVDDSTFDGNTVATLTASSGTLKTDRKITILDDEAPLLSIEFATSSLEEGKSTTGSVSRTGSSPSTPLVVKLSSSTPSLASVISSVTIPAGATSMTFTIIAPDDSKNNGTTKVSISASASEFATASDLLEIIDNDQPKIFLSTSKSEFSESDSVQDSVLSISRLNMDLTDSLEVKFESRDESEASIHAIVSIPAGETSVRVPIEIIDDLVADGDQRVTLVATAGTLQSSTTITVKDNDQPNLKVVVNSGELDESKGVKIANFEDIGLRLTEKSFYSGADQAGDFESGNLVFNNSYEPTFESWSGWSLSNQSDRTTEGFSNQYSAFAGSGANEDSATYAVGTAFAGSLIPTIHRIDSSPASTFESLKVTNTTYAALSMRNGDAFAKKFGGASGDDPDYLLLTIEGFNDEDTSIGEVKFYLADYRFVDNSKDYIVDQWTTIDLSKIASADYLAFSMTSSDVGAFGMNTPAYFALDDVQLAMDSDPIGFGTVSRNDADLSKAMTVQLSASISDAVQLPEFITIPAGESSVSFPFDVIDDGIASGVRQVEISAFNEGYNSVTDEIKINDDDAPSLLLSLNQASVSEGDGNNAIRGIVSRNTSSLSESIEVTLKGGPEIQERKVTIPAGKHSVGFSIGILDDQNVNGTRESILTALATGFESSAKNITVLDNDSAGFIVVESDESTHVSEIGASDAISIRLTARPLTNVVIDVHSSSEADLVLSTSQLVFTPDSWNAPQTLHVSGVADFEVEESETIELRFQIADSKSDIAFASIPEQVIEVQIDETPITDIELVRVDDQFKIKDTNSGTLFQLIQENDGLSFHSDNRSQNLTLDSSLVSESTAVFIELLGGDDAVELKGLGNIYLDGGDGHDRLTVSTATFEMDLDLFLADHAQNFEEIIVSTTSSDSINLDASKIASALSGTQTSLVLTIGENEVKASEQWEMREPKWIEGAFAQVLSYQSVELSLISSRPWRNAFNRFDVNHSGSVTAADALAIINRLPLQSNSLLPAPQSLADFNGNYVDVNGDGKMTALDALVVINSLHRQPAQVNAAAEWIESDRKAKHDKRVEGEVSTVFMSNKEWDIVIRPIEMMPLAQVDVVDAVMARWKMSDEVGLMALDGAESIER